MTGLEVVGLVFLFYLVASVVRALFNLLYTCYIGNALGRAIDVKQLGSWAGEMSTFFYIILIIFYALNLF